MHDFSVRPKKRIIAQDKQFVYSRPMIVRRALIGLIVPGLLALFLSGCAPSGETRWNEEKDPHYLTGKGRISSLDFDGAIQAFEKALESNPRSAAAHLELGFLYEEKKKRFATAVYHFEKHLELRPNSVYAEMVNQRVINCKLELARTVSFALVSHQVQDEMRRLNSTNALLRELNSQLRAELIQQAAAFSNRLAALTLAGTSQPQPQRPTPHPPYSSVVERSSPPAVQQPPTRQPQAVPLRPAALPRTHVIRRGDTMAHIARINNVRLDMLQAANPGVDPRRLQEGQVIRLP
jgi:tetratricopeptide (TPR) repeat protein